jgi:hypothetical protein
MICYDKDRIFPALVDVGPLRDVPDGEGQSELRRCTMNKQSPWQPRVETSFSARAEGGPSLDSFLPCLPSRRRRVLRNLGNMKEEA